MAMQAEPTAEQRAAALTEELPSAEEVDKDVAEYSLPPEVRVATNLIMLRVNEQTDGVLTLVPHMVTHAFSASTPHLTQIHRIRCRCPG